MPFTVEVMINHEGFKQRSGAARVKTLSFYQAVKEFMISSIEYLGREFGGKQ